MPTVPRDTTPTLRTFLGEAFDEPMPPPLSPTEKAWSRLWQTFELFKKAGDTKTAAKLEKILNTRDSPGRPERWIDEDRAGVFEAVQKCAQRHPELSSAWAICKRLAKAPKAQALGLSASTIYHLYREHCRAKGLDQKTAYRPG
jgi:hypothetical protein